MSLLTMARLSKAAIALMVAFFCLLVAIDNMIDFNTNYLFVKHVLAMDSMLPFFHGQHLEWRAITSPHWQLIGYWGIILGECLAGLSMLLGALQLLFGVKSHQRFCRGKAWYLLGGTIALAVWYFGFCVIGGEWFSMWANKWNGQMKAYAFATFIVITMVYILVAEPEADKA